MDILTVKSTNTYFVLNVCAVGGELCSLLPES